VRFLLLFALSSLAGCAAPELPIDKLPAVEAAGSGEVIVVRPSAFIADDFPFYLNVNHENILALGARQHARFRLPAGEQRIAIRCVSVVTGETSEKATNQRVVAGQTLYLSVAAAGSCASLKAVSEQEGRRLVSNTTFRPL
jgi:hypothetical protein